MLTKGGAALTDTEAKEFYDKLIPWYDKAIQQDDYDSGQLMLNTLVSVGKASKDRSVLQDSVSRRTDIQAAMTAFRASRGAGETLKKSTNDPDAAYAVAVYLAYYKGKWDAALPLFAKVGTEPIKTAAAMEGASPTDAKKQMEVGDIWWSISDTERVPLAQKQIRLHAGVWYSKSLPSLTGLEKAKVEKRLSVDDTDSAAYSFVVEAYIDGSSELHLVPSGIYWHNTRDSKPGMVEREELPDVH